MGIQYKRQVVCPMCMTLHHVAWQNANQLFTGCLYLLGWTELEQWTGLEMVNNKIVILGYYVKQHLILWEMMYQLEVLVVACLASKEIQIHHKCNLN